MRRTAHTVHVVMTRIIQFQFKKKLILKTYPPQSRSFERRICAQTEDLQILKKRNMSQMNPEEVFHNTAYSIQLPYRAGHPL